MDRRFQKKQDTSCKELKRDSVVAEPYRSKGLDAQSKLTNWHDANIHSPMTVYEFRGKHEYELI